MYKFWGIYHKLCPPFITFLYFYKYSINRFHPFLLIWNIWLSFFFFWFGFYFLKSINFASVPYFCSSSSISLSVGVVSVPILSMVPSYDPLILSIPCHSLFVCVFFFFKLQFCNKITAVCFSWIESEGRNNKTFCHIVLPSMTSKNNIKHDSNYPALLACLFKNREKESVDILLFQNVFVCLCQTYHIRQSF